MLRAALRGLCGERLGLGRGMYSLVSGACVRRFCTTMSMSMSMMMGPARRCSSG